MTDFWEWHTYEDASPFIAAEELEVSVIEELGGQGDGHRVAVLEASGPLDFVGPQTNVRILFDSNGVEYLRSALKQLEEQFLSDTGGNP